MGFRLCFPSEAIAVNEYQNRGYVISYHDFVSDGSKCTQHPGDFGNENVVAICDPVIIYAGHHGDGLQDGRMWPNGYFRDCLYALH